MKYFVHKRKIHDLISIQILTGIKYDMELSTSLILVGEYFISMPPSVAFNLICKIWKFTHLRISKRIMSQMFSSNFFFDDSLTPKLQFSDVAPNFFVFLGIGQETQTQQNHKNCEFHLVLIDFFFRFISEVCLTLFGSNWIWSLETNHLYSLPKDRNHNNTYDS